MISRGLLISVGVTLLAVGLVFVYFRNKVSGIEKKVELMFNLIQNYESQQNMAQSGERFMTQSSNDEENYPQPNVQQLKSELIEVSDDEDNDSEEVSDEEDDSEDEDEQTLKFEPTNIELKEEDIKTIQLEEINQQEDNNDDEQEDSLDEDDSEDEEEEEDDDANNDELEATEVITLTEEDYKKKTVAELKKLASERGLQNYRSLKKAPLIQLLMSQ